MISLKIVAILCVLCIKVSEGYDLGSKSGSNGLVVTIDKDLPEEGLAYLVDHIQLFLKETANALYKATMQKVHLQDITIVIPRELNDSFSLPSTPIKKSHLHVTTEGIEMDMPYTVQGGRCRAPGSKIYVPENVFSFEEIEIEEASAKMMANELLKLRYGVFDEFGNDVFGELYPYAYMDKKANEIRLTSCSDYPSINGSWVHSNDSSKDCSPESDPMCIYDIHSIGVNYSVMFTPDFQEVTQICTEETHDIYAPTYQNKICGKSVMSVILEHPDFGEDSVTEPEQSFSNPKIHIVSETDTMPLIVLVCANGKNESVNTRAVQRDVINGTEKLLSDSMYAVPYFGLGYYRGNASTFQLKFFENSPFLYVPEINLNKISVFSRRQGLEFLSDYSECPVSLALSETMSMIKEALGVSIGNINLLSIQTLPTSDELFLMDVEPYIHISSVLYGTEEDNPWIENKTMETGGVYHETEQYVGTKSSAVISSLGEKIDDFVTVIRSSTTNESFRFYIDESIGLQTIVTVKFIEKEGEHTTVLPYESSPATTGVPCESSSATTVEGSTVSQLHNNSVTLTLYDGTTIEPDVVDSQTQMFTFLIDEAEEGDYVLEMNYLDGYQSAITALSHEKPDVDQIVIEVWSSSPNPIHNLATAPIAFYCSILNGNKDLVTNLNHVELHLYNNKKDTAAARVLIPMLDNGSGDPDFSANDGIYSGYLIDLSPLELTENNVTVYADIMLTSNSADDSALWNKPIFRSSFERKNVNFRNISMISLRIDRMNKLVFVQSLMGAKDYNPPPSRIIDFEVASVRQNKTDDVIVQLQWTAPGGNLTEGQISDYDLRYTNDESIYSNFELWTVVQKSDFIRDITEIPNYGDNQTVIIALPKIAEEKTTYVAAIRGIDKEGNKGEVSPKVFIYALEGPPLPIIPPENNDFIDSAWFIVLMVLVGLLLLAILGLALYLCMKRRSQRSTDYNLSTTYNDVPRSTDTNFSSRNLSLPRESNQSTVQMNNRQSISTISSSR